MDNRTINRAVAGMFRGYDKEFVNELARLLIQYHHEFYINTSHRLAMFLAHVKAEVDVRHHKVMMREIMNYSARRLMQVFRRFRRHPAWARKWGRTKYHKANERMIANIAYGGRLGNDGIHTDDGWIYRGAGVLQTTGKANLRPELKIIEEKTGIKLFDDHGRPFPYFLDSYTGGILLGMADWYRSKMYTAKTMDESTRIINRYTDSYAKRRRYYAQAKRLIDSWYRYA